MSNSEKFNVICIDIVYDDGRYIDLYQIGSVYEACYLYDKCDMYGYFIEFEWIVWCAKHNHYQFTDSDFKKFFIDQSHQRDNTINDILI